MVAVELHMNHVSKNMTTHHLIYPADRKLSYKQFKYGVYKLDNNTCIHIKAKVLLAAASLIQLCLLGPLKRKNLLAMAIKICVIKDNRKSHLTDL